MQVVVKTARIKINMEGDIPSDVLKVITKAFNNKVKIFNDDGEEVVIVTETDWFKEIKKNTTPGDVVKIYRGNRDWSQADLGKKIGKSRQFIADLEKGRRKVSLNLAKQLAKLYDIPVERFLELD